ncbi:MAG: HAMP domain-containing histidine kinase [Armatimonadetes bacterium]|nr:HAMP domain-containing histidine kinase [Armatimonadota bacterium]
MKLPNLDKIGFKLSLILILILFLALFLIGSLDQFFFFKNFKDYLILHQKEKEEKIIRILKKIYKEDENWGGLEEQIPYFCMMLGTCIKLEDSKGKIVANYCVNRELMKEEFPINEKNSIILPLYFNNKFIAKVYLNSDMHSEPSLKQDIIFQKSIKNSFLFSGLISGILILILSLILSKKFLKPIYELTKATEEIFKGNLNYPIKLKGQDELSNLSFAFNQMREKIKNQEFLRKKLILNLAHELRTPLTTLKGYLKGIEDKVFSLNEELIKSFQEEIERLVNLIEDLQKISYLEKDTLNLKMSLFNLKDLIESIAKNLNFHFKEKNINLNFNLQNIEISLDKNLIAQAIYNILHNAYKYTLPGGEINLSLIEKQNIAQIKIKDNGIGIESKDLAYIFERFYRADQSRSRLTGGTGIGLAIAKEAVLAHKGDIKVNSEFGRGTEFTIILPNFKNS